MVYSPQGLWTPPRTATLVIAASDSSDRSKVQADYVCDGIADNEEIQAANDALPSTGGNIRFSEGTFTPAIRLLIDTEKNITFEGFSRDATILQMAVGARSLLTLDGTAGTNTVTVADASGFYVGSVLTIVDDVPSSESDHVITDVTGNVITFSTNLHANHTTANNARALETNSMFSIADSYNLVFKDFTIDMNKAAQPEAPPDHSTASAFSGNACDLVGYEGRLDVDIQNLVIKNVSNKAISLYGGTNINVSNNYFEDIGEAVIDVDHSSAVDEGQPYSVTIIGNRMRNVGHNEPAFNGGAIVIEGTHSYAHAIVVANNSIDDCYIGMHLLHSVGGVQVTGNIVRKSTYIAYWIEGDANNLVGNTADLCEIAFLFSDTSEDNQAIGNLIRGVRTAFNCASGSRGNVIKGNQIIGQIGSYCFYIRGSDYTISGNTACGLDSTVDVFRVFDADNRIEGNTFYSEGAAVASTTLTAGADIGDVIFTVVSTAGFKVGYPITITLDDASTPTFVVDEVISATSIKVYDTAQNGILDTAAIGKAVVSNETVAELMNIQASATNTAIRNNNFLVDSPGGTDSGTGTQLENNRELILRFNRHIVRAKNASGGALSAGSVVVYGSAATADYACTTTTAQGDDKIFGIAVESINNNEYGHIQTLGKTVLLKVDGTTDIAIGDFLCTFTVAGISAKAGAGDCAYAIALEAYTTDDSNGVIDALLITPRKL